MHGDQVAGLLEDRVAPLALVQQGERLFGASAEDDVDMVEADGSGGAHAFISPSGLLPPLRALLQHAVEHDGDDDDRSPASTPSATLLCASARTIGVAEAAGADQRGDHDHRERQHDALGDARHDGRQRGRQLRPW